MVNQAIRHLVIIGFSLKAVIFYRNAFSSRRLNNSFKLILIGSSFALIISIFKFHKFESPYLLLYQALEPVFVICSAMAISGRVEHARNSLIIFAASLVFGIFVFFVLHYSAGESLIASHYNRPRLTLGFDHPGKFAQHITLIFLVVFYFLKLNRIFYKFLKAIFLISLIILVFQTSTRAMISIIAIVGVYHAISYLRRNQAGTFLVVFGAVGFINLLALLIFSDREYLSYLVSGRLLWWNMAIFNHLDEYGFGILLHGITGPMIGNLGAPAELIDINTLRAIRFDNGYLEVGLQSGLVPLIFYVMSILKLGSKASFKLNNSLSLVSIMLFFNIGESGFLAVGNSFGFVLMVMLATFVRLNSESVFPPKMPYDTNAKASD